MVYILESHKECRKKELVRSLWVYYPKRNVNPKPFGDGGSRALEGFLRGQFSKLGSLSRSPK